jgi:hypothetical protein
VRELGLVRIVDRSSYDKYGGRAPLGADGPENIPMDTYGGRRFQTDDRVAYFHARMTFNEHVDLLAATTVSMSERDPEIGAIPDVADPDVLATQRAAHDPHVEVRLLESESYPSPVRHIGDR